MGYPPALLRLGQVLPVQRSAFSVQRSAFLPEVLPTPSRVRSNAYLLHPVIA